MRSVRKRVGTSKPALARDRVNDDLSILDGLSHVSISLGIKSTSDLYWLHIGSDERNNPIHDVKTENDEGELTLSQKHDSESCVSLDSFGASCLKDYLETSSSTSSQGYCIGRSLYNDDDNIEEFYRHLKHISDSHDYIRNYLSKPMLPPGPTPMARLLSAQISIKNTEK